MKKLLTLFFVFLFSILTFSQTDFTEQDKEICISKFRFAADKELADKPINEVIAEIGKSFIGTDYEAYTLEKEGIERLSLHLTGFDCTTFLENTLAFARCIKAGKTSFEDFQNELIKIRYRNGIINQYPSRLHYFSDWIYDNSQKGIVEDITKNIGGVICPNKVSYMTKNRDRYKQIKMNDQFYDEIKKQEKEINSRVYYYIPKNKISGIEDKIKTGYLIAFTSNVAGLIISHVGIAIKMNDGRIHLLHAATIGSTIHISKRPLSEYIAKNSKQTGIIILKPIDP